MKKENKNVHENTMQNYINGDDFIQQLNTLGLHFTLLTEH